MGKLTAVIGSIIIPEIPNIINEVSKLFTSNDANIPCEISSIELIEEMCVSDNFLCSLKLEKSTSVIKKLDGSWYVESMKSDPGSIVYTKVTDAWVIEALEKEHIIYKIKEKHERV